MGSSDEKQGKTSKKLIIKKQMEDTMGQISREIGQKIRTFRKARHMTLEEMAQILCKNKSTLSKYETGEIVLDIETIYEISRALGIHVEQLLYCTPDRVPIQDPGVQANFFSGLTQFYGYYYDGRVNRIVPAVFDVLLQSENNRYKIMMYMNYTDFDSYQNCGTACWGYMEHYDAITNINLTNQDSPMEQAFCQVLATFTTQDTIWGLFTGLSARPMMPVAIKMLFSKKRLSMDGSLLEKLKVTKEDIRLMKMYNMMTVL